MNVTICLVLLFFKSLVKENTNDISLKGVKINLEPES